MLQQPARALPLVELGLRQDVHQPIVIEIAGAGLVSQTQDLHDDLRHFALQREKVSLHLADLRLGQAGELGV